MRLGIVAEGPADIAVLRNILKGWLGLERDQVFPIRPDLAEDETDVAGYRAPRPEEFSNWRLVIEECRAHTGIQTFLDNLLDDEGLVVVQIDTAEAHLDGYDVARPDRKDPSYADLIRALVIAKLDALLGPTLAVRVRYAIAVEETDAWVLTLYEDGKKDTGSILNPKKKLDLLLSKSKTRTVSKSGYDRYHALTVDFRTRKKLDACAKRNRSLRRFVDSL